GGARGGGVGGFPAARAHDHRRLAGQLAGPAPGRSVGGDHPHGGEAGQETEDRDHEDQGAVAGLLLREEGRRAPAGGVEDLAHSSTPCAGWGVIRPSSRSRTGRPERAIRSWSWVAISTVV